MGERLNNDFMLENILELYKEKMSRLEYVNPLDNIYINGFLASLMSDYFLAREDAPEDDYEIIDDWISLLGTKTKLVADYIKENYYNHWISKTSIHPKDLSKSPAVAGFFVSPTFVLTFD